MLVLTMTPIINTDQRVKDHARANVWVRLALAAAVGSGVLGCATVRPVVPDISHPANPLAASGTLAPTDVSLLAAKVPDHDGQPEKTGDTNPHAHH